MNYEILDIETAKKIARLEKENEKLKEEIRNLKDQMLKGVKKDENNK